jgi:hypothetical protein
MLTAVFGAYSVIHGLGAKGAVDHYWFATQCGFDCLQKLSQPLKIGQLLRVWRVVQQPVVSVRQLGKRKVWGHFLLNKSVLAWLPAEEPK